MKKIFFLLSMSCAMMFYTKAQTDSSNTITMTPFVQQKNMDSTQQIQQIISQLDSQKIVNFKTFSAKGKINSSNIPVPLTANIRIQKDSIIWVSLTATMLITTEVARAMITPDSVLVMDKLHKTITRRSIAYLQTLLKVPFTFNDVQNIILGNPLLTGDSLISNSCSNGVLSILLSNGTLNNNLILQSLDSSKLLMTRSLLQDSTVDASCEIAYDNYQPIENGKYFSQTRNITATNKDAELQATLQFINFNFDEPVDFPFNIPENYTEK